MCEADVLIVAFSCPAEAFRSWCWRTSRMEWVRCTEGFSSVHRWKSCRGTSQRSRWVTSSGTQTDTSVPSLIWLSEQEWERDCRQRKSVRAAFPPVLQGSRWSSRSGPRPRREPRGRLCVWRRRRGSGQSRASRAQRSLASRHLLPGHRWDDRRRGREPLQPVGTEEATKECLQRGASTATRTCCYLGVCIIIKNEP